MIGRTIVVGAGLSGLSAAWAVARDGADVEVFEASDRPGGVVRTERRDGFLLELGPNTVRPTAPVWGLVGTLGLAGGWLFADPRAPRYVDFAGELHPLPMGPVALLRSRLYDAQRQKLDSERAADRRSQVGSGDRSERIRTYNFPQGRVTDHRINLTLYKLPQVMSGEALGELIDALTTEHQAAQLAAQGAAA